MEVITIIKEYLIEQGLYHESDDILLKEMEFNLEMMETCKEDIRENGVKLDITRNPDKESYLIKNKAVDVYQMALKNVQSIFRSLILSPSERQKLKLELLKGVDEFDRAFK